MPRRDRAPLRMFPSKKRFIPDNLLGLGASLLLIEKIELVAVER
jgi:hypothetical protein